MNRRHFRTLLSPAYIPSFCPFDRNAIPREAVALLTKKAAPQGPVVTDEPEPAAATDHNQILSLQQHPNQCSRQSKQKEIGFEF